MNNGWTPQRKAKQSKAIQSWKPWEMATGPRTPAGKAKVSRNAWKGGKRPAFRKAMKELGTAVAALDFYDEVAARGLLD